MNERGSVGWGYDFVLMQGEKELRYIEVKGRTTDEGVVELSPTQWAFARDLYTRNEGEKFSLFIVLNAGKTTASLITVNNPVQIWLEGNLMISEKITLSGF
jgi:hypothetical protein